MRTAYHDHTREVPKTQEEKRQKAKERFETAATCNGELIERMVTASEDHTMYLWEPTKSNKPLARLLGHQKGVNHVTFSPDGRILASASFDNSVKLFNLLGKFISYEASGSCLGKGSLTKILHYAVSRVAYFLCIVRIP